MEMITGTKTNITTALSRGNKAGNKAGRKARKHTPICLIPDPLLRVEYERGWSVMSGGAPGAWARYLVEDVDDAEGFISKERERSYSPSRRSLAGATVNVGTLLAQVA